MAGGTLWLFKRRRACRVAGGRILVATAATACAPTLPPCVSCAVKFPKRESQSQDSACPGPAQRLPLSAAGPGKWPVIPAINSCDGMSHVSRGLKKLDRLGPRVIEPRRRQRPAEH